MWQTIINNDQHIMITHNTYTPYIIHIYMTYTCTHTHTYNIAVYNRWEKWWCHDKRHAHKACEEKRGRKDKERKRRREKLERKKDDMHRQLKIINSKVSYIYTQITGASCRHTSYNATLYIHAILVLLYQSPPPYGLTPHTLSCYSDATGHRTVS